MNSINSGAGYELGAFSMTITTAPVFNGELFVRAQMQVFETNALASKFAELRSVLGNALFNRLSDEDKKFMAKTAGVIDLGHPVDLDVIAQSIENYDDTDQ